MSTIVLRPIEPLDTNALHAIFIEPEALSAVAPKELIVGLLRCVR